MLKPRSINPQSPNRQSFCPYLQLLRPKHWIKNLFLFSAPFFGGSLLREDVLQLSIPVFLSFSLSASSGYIFNDIMDRERDRVHPEKNRRPIASGLIKPKKAFFLLASLLLPSLYVSFLIGFEYLLFVVLYLMIQSFYSLKLKGLAIVDIFCIASGFVIRVMAGGAAFNVDVSPWLFLTMLMISLVLASGKRLAEISLLNTNASDHRTSLRDYSTGFLREILIISSATSLVTYALYTVEQSPGLIYTIPVVTFGLFRYLMLADKGLGDPTEALTKDLYLIMTVIVWLVIVWIVRYQKTWRVLGLHF